MINSPPTIAVSNENVITPFIICMFNCMILGRHAFNDHANYLLVATPSYLLQFRLSSLLKCYDRPILKCVAKAFPQRLVWLN